MAALLLPLVLVPLSLTYALLAPRVERAGVLARRAVVFAVADRTLTLLALLPLAALGAVLYLHRHESIARFVSAHAWQIGGLVAVAMAGAFAARPLRRALERLFFRPRADSAQQSARWTRELHEAIGDRELGPRLLAALAEALPTESMALWLPGRGGGELTDVSGILPPIASSSALAMLAGWTATDAALLASFDDVERQWIEQNRVHALVPFGRSAGLLALGESMSGLPFSNDDRARVESLLTTASLLLENFALRAAPAVATPPRRDDAERAAICPACGAVFDPLGASRCPEDDTPLAAGDVPYVLHGKLRFERRIGAGTMGVVYRARDLVLGRDVAIKTLPVLSPGAAARAQREAKAAAALSHPAIATIHSLESWRGRPLLVLELLDGGTLADRLARGPLSPEWVIRRGGEVADGLAHAHAAGLLHRDVKPSNIAFHREGGAKILDFGLSSVHGDGAAMEWVGTPRYLSPEAIVGLPPSPAGDVWSLAVTLYEAATGHNPFAAATSVLAMNAVLAGTCDDPRELREEVPERLALLLLHALARDPARRLQTAAEFRDALRESLLHSRVRSTPRRDRTS
jgi:tRNA A-37 threonylcarbamoyl transferase component Bud32